MIRDVIAVEQLLYYSSNQSWQSDELAQQGGRGEQVREEEGYELVHSWAYADTGGRRWGEKARGNSTGASQIIQKS